MQICKVYRRWFIYFTNIDISINVIKSVWRVRKHETQSNRESCVFHFSRFELYFALHSCVLSTFKQHLLLFPTTIYISIYIYIYIYIYISISISIYIYIYIYLYISLLLEYRPSATVRQRSFICSSDNLSKLFWWCERKILLLMIQRFYNYFIFAIFFSPYKNLLNNLGT